MLQQTQANGKADWEQEFLGFCLCFGHTHGVSRCITRALTSQKQVAAVRVSNTSKRDRNWRLHCWLCRARAQLGEAVRVEFPAPSPSSASSHPQHEAGAACSILSHAQFMDTAADIAPTGVKKINTLNGISTLQLQQSLCLPWE